MEIFCGTVGESIVITGRVILLLLCMVTCVADIGAS